MANSATRAAPALSGTRALPREASGFLLRLRTWVRQSQLDAHITGGRRRPGDPALALRESQLVEPRGRRQLATRLEEVIEASKLSQRSGARAPVDRRAVAAARPVLADLVDLLRSSDRVEPRGMALGWRLLTDPGSPLYEAEEFGPSEGARLWRESLDVLEELRPA